MALRKNTHRFRRLVVEQANAARLPFPLDMLRYDMAHPATESDSAAMLATIEDRVPNTRLRVSLSAACVLPTDGRWESFGWRVVSFSEIHE